MTAPSKDKADCIAGNILSCLLIIIIAIVNAFALCVYNWWDAMLSQSIFCFIAVIVWHILAVIASVRLFILSNTTITIDENGATEKFLNKTLHKLSWKDIKRIEIVEVNPRCPRLFINVMSVDKESFNSQYGLMTESSKRRITFLYRKRLLNEIKSYCDVWIYGWERTVNYAEKGRFRT